MCNEEFTHPSTLSSDPIAGPVSQFTVEEISEAVSKIKNGIATRADGIPSEI